MTLPLISDYKAALINARLRFATLKVTPQLDSRRQPHFLAGNFACVFKVCDSNGTMLAVKCFTRVMPDLEKRYRALAHFIKTAHPTSMIELHYLPSELFTTSSVAPSADYPVVVMPWIEGMTLGGAVATLCRKDNRRALGVLTRTWARLCHDLLTRKIAHGDLKHDNVIITPDSKLKLIDYDSFYLPELKGLPAPLLGGINFQHPSRDAGHFDETVDHFSILVILLSLRALTFEPTLIDNYNNGENLIFTRDDFSAPGSSELIGRLLKSPDLFVRDWSQQLVKACQSHSIRVPGIKAIITSAVNLEATAQEGGPKRLFSFLGVTLSR
ncbi:non-specific serine/threonine protein kinase [uncultured Gammaproteobacteria bacterium]